MNRADKTVTPLEPKACIFYPEQKANANSFSVISLCSARKKAEMTQPFEQGPVHGSFPPDFPEGSKF